MGRRSKAHASELSDNSSGAYSDGEASYSTGGRYKRSFDTVSSNFVSSKLRPRNNKRNIVYQDLDSDFDELLDDGEADGGKKNEEISLESLPVVLDKVIEKFLIRRVKKRDVTEASGNAVESFGICEIDGEEEDDYSNNNDEKVWDNSAAEIPDTSDISSPPVELKYSAGQSNVSSDMSEKKSVQYEYLVKYHNISYNHCEWVDEESVLSCIATDRPLRTRFNNFIRKVEAGMEIPEAELVKAIPERIVDCSDPFRALYPTKVTDMSRPDWTVYCLKIVDALVCYSRDHRRYGVPFLRPVDEEKDGAPGYYDIVKSPMDFMTVQTKLYLRYYASPQEFWADVKRIFSNCLQYNSCRTEIAICCRFLEALFDKLYHEWACISRADPEKIEASSLGIDLPYVSSNTPDLTLEKAMQHISFQKELKNTERSILYLVKWKNCSYTEMSWEFPSEISDKMKIAQYHRYARVPEYVVSTKGPGDWGVELQRKMLQETLVHCKAAREFLYGSMAIPIQALPALSSAGMQHAPKERWFYHSGNVRESVRQQHSYPRVCPSNGVAMTAAAAASVAADHEQQNQQAMLCHANNSMACLGHYPHSSQMGSYGSIGAVGAAATLIPSSFLDPRSFPSRTPSARPYADSSIFPSSMSFPALLASRFSRFAPPNSKPLNRVSLNGAINPAMFLAQNMVCGAQHNFQTVPPLVNSSTQPNSGGMATSCTPYTSPHMYNYYPPPSHHHHHHHHHHHRNSAIPLANGTPQNTVPARHFLVPSVSSMVQMPQNLSLHQQLVPQVAFPTPAYVNRQFMSSVPQAFQQPRVPHDTKLVQYSPEACLGPTSSSSSSSSPGHIDPLQLSLQRSDLSTLIEPRATAQYASSPNLCEGYNAFPTSEQCTTRLCMFSSVAWIPFLRRSSDFYKFIPQSLYDSVVVPGNWDFETSSGVTSLQVQCYDASSSCEGYMGKYCEAESLSEFSVNVLMRSENTEFEETNKDAQRLNPSIDIDSCLPPQQLSGCPSKVANSPSKDYSFCGSVVFPTDENTTVGVSDVKCLEQSDNLKQESSIFCELSDLQPDRLDRESKKSATVQHLESKDDFSSEDQQKDQHLKAESAESLLRSSTETPSTSSLTPVIDRSRPASFAARSVYAEQFSMMKRPKAPPPGVSRHYPVSPIYKGNRKLFDYQLDGLNWMLDLWSNGNNGILADDLGLGKTVQSVAFLWHLYSKERMRGPFLVIAPLSTLEHWRCTAEEWTDLNVILYYDEHGRVGRDALRSVEWYYFMMEMSPTILDDSARKGPSSGDQSDTMTARIVPTSHYKFHLLLTSYEIFSSDAEILIPIPWQYVILDEAHKLKNRLSKTLQLLRQIACRHTLLLTGTPVQNNTEELWPLLNYIEPVRFCDVEAFKLEFGNLQTNEQVTRLTELLRPHLLRRVKEDVADSIPPLEETIIDVELTILQKAYYKAIFERNKNFLFKNARKGQRVPNLRNVDMELRKCCNHPFMIYGVEQREYSTCKTEAEKFKKLVESSGKLVLLDKLLPKLKDEGHKVLIFSQFQQTLSLIQEFITYKGWEFERLDGQVKGVDRSGAIARFNDPQGNRFIFLLSTRAGGLGINLTSADTVIIFDSDWNPQNDIQATARAHRIGQEREVKVYRLLTARTYEADMFDRASKKLGLNTAVFQCGAFDSKLRPVKAGNLNLDEKLSGGTSSKTPSKEEVEELLKNGAFYLLEGSAKAAREFQENNIEEILSRNSRLVRYQLTGMRSTFSKTSFKSDKASDLSLDDPDFWKKVLNDSSSRRLLARLNDGSATENEASMEEFMNDLQAAVEGIAAEDDPEPVIEALVQLSNLTTFSAAQRKTAEEWLRRVNLNLEALREVGNGDVSKISPRALSDSGHESSSAYGNISGTAANLENARLGTVHTSKKSTASLRRSARVSRVSDGQGNFSLGYRGTNEERLYWLMAVEERDRRRTARRIRRSMRDRVGTRGQNSECVEDVGDRNGEKQSTPSEIRRSQDYETSESAEAFKENNNSFNQTRGVSMHEGYSDEGDAGDLDNLMSDEASILEHGDEDDDYDDDDDDDGDVRQKIRRRSGNRRGRQKRVSGVRRGARRGSYGVHGERRMRQKKNYVDTNDLMGPLGDNETLQKLPRGLGRARGKIGSTRGRKKRSLLTFTAPTALLTTPSPEIPLTEQETLDFHVKKRALVDLSSTTDPTNTVNSKAWNNSSSTPTDMT